MCVQDELQVAHPDTRIEPHSQHAAAAQAERFVCAAVGVAEDQEVIESLSVLVAGQRLRAGERDHHDADAELT
jgi:hypothetical protein